MQEIRQLNKRQCALESALGSTEKTASMYAESGDHEKASELSRLALAIKALRDPEVEGFLVRRALKRAQPGAVA